MGSSKYNKSDNSEFEIKIHQPQTQKSTQNPNQTQKSTQNPNQTQTPTQTQNDTDTISNVGNPVININIGTDLNGGGAGAGTGTGPAYGNFWSDQPETVPGGARFTFNHSSNTAGGVTLVSPDTVRIVEPGDYHVSYIVSVALISPATLSFATTSVFLNNVEVPASQTTFTVADFIPPHFECIQLTSEAIITIPANSTLQLFSSNTEISTCGGGRLGNVVELTVIKVSR